MGTSSSKDDKEKQQHQKSIASRSSKKPQIQIKSELEDEIILGFNQINSNELDKNQNSKKKNKEKNLFIKDNRRKEDPKNTPGLFMAEKRKKEGIKDIPEELKNKAVLINYPKISELGNVNNNNMGHYTPEDEKSIENDNDNNNIKKIEVESANNINMDNKTTITIKRKNSKKSVNHLSSDDEDNRPNNPGLNFIERQRNNVFYNMYISNVYNRLREIDNCSDVDAQRWPYELLQNAKDSISGDKTRNAVNVIFDVQEDFVNICHDGAPFNAKQFYALLYKYSEGKDKNKNESTGRFGTGFLTTHLLSKTVRIEGPLYQEDDDSKIIGIMGFLVTMYREGITKEDLLKGLRRTEKEKKFYPNKQPKWTKYTYFLKTERNHSASILGYENLKINIFLTMVFNKVFNSIIIQYLSDKYIYTNKSIIDKNLGSNIRFFDFEFYDEINDTTLQKKYLYTKYKKYSKILSEHFGTKRDLTIEACIEVDSDKNIIIDEKSPCLFCSLPLVGSELHVLPLILNSNDFEPSTERQEILLNGDDENELTKTPTDVGVNKSILIESMELYKDMVKYASKNKYKNLHYFVRGINKIPKQKKYFDRKWYKEKFIIPMREIIYKIPVIYIDDDKLDYIQKIFFPIYDGIDNEIFYYLCKEIYKNVPEYKTSLQWSEYIWDEDLEGNKITVEKLVDEFSKKTYSVKFTNDLIKFIWDNYKEIPPKKPLLINQNEEYIIYNENTFCQDVNVSQEIINCLEDLGHQWKKNHLHKCITSIELPVKHSIKEAITFIRDKIKEDEKNSITLCKYINKNNSHRKNVYYFTKKFLDQKIGNEIFVTNFNKEIYTECDKYLIEKITEYVEKRGTFNNLNISDPEYETLLVMVYNYYGSEDIFNRKKLLLSEDGKFEFLHSLKKNVNIPVDVINRANDCLKINLNRVLISDKIKNLKLNIKNYTMDDFMLVINPKLVLEQTNKKDKEKMAEVLLQYIPKINSTENTLAIEQLRKQKKIRYIYEVLTGYTIEEKQIETNYEFFWTNVNNIIIDLCQETAEGKKDLKNYSDKKTNYIEILNEYGEVMFDLDYYAIIPSENGKFQKASELIDFCDIDDELVNGLIKIYNDTNLKLKILHKSVKLDIVKKETINDFGNKVYEKMQHGDSENNLEMAKILIKFIPKNAEYTKTQIQLYNMYNIFEKLGAIKQIQKCKPLFNEFKKCLVKDILERIDKSGNLSNINEIVKDYTVFINTYHNILETTKNVYDKYKIIPNQNGVFKFGKDLTKDDELYPELCDLINEYRDKDKKYALKDVLMHNSITFYNPTQHIKNSDLAKFVNELLKKEYLDPLKILEFYPVDEKSIKTQEKLRFIYENLENLNKPNNKKLRKIIIDLPQLWESANELIIKECFLKHIQYQQLKSLNKDEDVAIKILETFYEFINPELNANSGLQIVPNYYGELKAYKELKEPTDLSENFIEMMKKYFEHDIRKYLKHDKIKFRLKQKFEFDKDICDLINYKLTGFGSQQTARAKEFIKFYPSEKIRIFIYCYKILGKKNFEEEPIEINNVSLWDNAIAILSKDLIEYFKYDNNLDNLCKRTDKNEAEIIKILNLYYSFYYHYMSHDKIESKDLLGKNKLESGDLLLPNYYGEFMKYDQLSKNEGISDQLKKIMKLLDEENDYNKTLIHEKIELNYYSNSKKEEDILKDINDKVEELYGQREERNCRISENFREACSLILKEWGPNHQKEFKKKLPFVYLHKMDIIMKVILDDDVQQRYEVGLSKDPEKLINYLNGFNL